MLGFRKSRILLHILKWTCISDWFFLTSKISKGFLVPNDASAPAWPPGVRWRMSRQKVVIPTFNDHNYFRSIWKYVHKYSLLPNIRSVQVCKLRFSTVSVRYLLFHALMVDRHSYVLIETCNRCNYSNEVMLSYCRNYWTFKHSNSLIIKECVFCTHSLIISVCGPIQTIG